VLKNRFNVFIKLINNKRIVSSHYCNVLFCPLIL